MIVSSGYFGIPVWFLQRNKSAFHSGSIWRGNHFANELPIIRESAISLAEEREEQSPRGDDLIPLHAPTLIAPRSLNLDDPVTPHSPNIPTYIFNRSFSLSLSPSLSLSFLIIRSANTKRHASTRFPNLNRTPDRLRLARSSARPFGKRHGETLERRRGATWKEFVEK